MRHDHHQEEIERRWQRTRQYDYDEKAVRSGRGKPEKQPKPSFWLWVRLSVEHCYICFATLVACVIAGYFLLASDGVIQSTIWTEHELMIYSTIFSIMAIVMISGVAISWRAFKYYQPDDDEDADD